MLERIPLCSRCFHFKMMAAGKKHIFFCALGETKTAICLRDNGSYFTIKPAFGTRDCDSDPVTIFGISQEEAET